MGSKLFQQSQWSGCLRAAGIAQALQVVRAQQQRRLAALDSRGATVNQRGTLPGSMARGAVSGRATEILRGAKRGGAVMLALVVEGACVGAWARGCGCGWVWVGG